ncbi:MAG: hypothetical protein KJ767_00225 [Nanoarchaeota archaeon]|nr:hypothetical protein [Nanoarchaeota archaeon]
MVYCYRLWCGGKNYDLVHGQEYNNQEFAKTCDMASVTAISELLKYEDGITEEKIFRKTHEILIRKYNFKELELKPIPRVEKMFIFRELNTLDSLVRMNIEMPEELIQKILNHNQKFKK